MRSSLQSSCRTALRSFGPFSCSECKPIPACKDNTLHHTKLCILAVFLRTQCPHKSYLYPSALCDMYADLALQPGWKAGESAALRFSPSAESSAPSRVVEANNRTWHVIERPFPDDLKTHSNVRCLQIQAPVPIAHVIESSAQAAMAHQ